MTPGSPGSEKPVLALPGVQQPEDASRDGRTLTYSDVFAATFLNIWLLPLQSGAKPVPWRQPTWNETSPRFSPDGTWIAYESDETGETEVYVARTAGGADKRRISPAGGKAPRWRRDGKELYYLARGGSLMSVAISSGSTWQAGPPAVLFQPDAEIENYDVALDGSRFLASVPAEKFRASPLRVILNWPTLAKKAE
jgi:Tol biopolymer transport system component